MLMEETNNATPQGGVIEDLLFLRSLIKPYTHY